MKELTVITLNLNCHNGRTFPQHYKIKRDYKYVLHQKVRVCEPVTVWGAGEVYYPASKLTSWFTRQTNHANDFVTAKSHAKEKPLLAG